MDTLSTPAASITPSTDVWTVTWRCGPDAGGRYVLGPGRHVVGRAPTTDVRCDDPALDRHEGTLEIDPGGTVAFRPFTGSRRTVGAGGLQVGASTLTVEPGRQDPSEHATIVDGAVMRAPRVVPRFEPIDVPDTPSDPGEPDRPGGLLPALLGLAGAALMALVLRQVMFLIFGAVGSSVALGSWLTQRLAVRRRRRRGLEDHRRAVAAREAAIAANRSAELAWRRRRVPTLADALATSAGHGASLWARRADHADAFVVSLGERSEAADVPVDASLGDGDRLAVFGAGALAVARSIVAQLTASCGPADLRIVVVTDRPGRWEALAMLPHLLLPDATAAIVDEAGLAAALELLGTRDQAHLLVVTDSPRALATRTSPLRRLLGTARTALLAALDCDAGVPHVCTAVLRCDDREGWWTNDTQTQSSSIRLCPAGLGVVAMARHARALGALHDPEDVLAGDARLPQRVAFLDIVEPLGEDPAAEIARRWQATARRPPRTPIGVAADGLVDIDLLRDGPHGLLAGTTGSGKSELLRTLVAGLALHTTPDRLAIVLVDYKGGASFDALVRLPHVVGVITDLDGRLADRALRSLQAELRRREAVLREHGVADLATLHERCSDVSLPRLLVVIDEFAALVAEQPDFLHALVGVAQRGRSLGVHLLLATQRPHGVISDDIRANTDLRIALRLLDQADALDVVGDRAPATLPRTVPGRGVLRLGADEHVTFQTALVPADAIGPLVDAIVAAADRSGVATPDAPWLPPLPRRLRPLDLPHDALGLCDDPDHQARVPLRWTPEDGDVLVVGSARTGRSSALRLLAAAALDEPDTHVYVLHADTSCAAMPHQHARVVRIHIAERERVARMLHRLRHTATDVTAPRRVLVVDDLDEIRRSLADPDRSGEYDDLDAVLADTGIRLLAGATRPTAVPASVIARCAHRWVLHLHDPLDAGVLGVTPACVPPATPGRALVLPEGLDVQLAVPTRGHAQDGARHAAGTRSAGPVPPIDPIDPIPATVTADVLVAARRADGDDADVLPVGVDCTSGATAGLEVPEGEHLLVLGAARTGRSTTLTRLILAWRAVHPEGSVAAVLPRRSAVGRHHVDEIVPASDVHALTTFVAAGEAARRPLLVVIDDAELVDDPDGTLAGLAASRRPGCTVVAAARPDAIRQVYGHWTGVVRRSRLGVVAAGGNDTDGDLLGVVLPRRTAIAPRPGLVWIVDRGTATLAQVATDTGRSVDGLRAAN